MNDRETIKNETLLIDGIIKEPLKDHVVLLYNHFSRYAAAIQKLGISQNDIVVDASCGYGYGAYILSRHAKQVYGLDVNTEYLSNAKRIFGSEKILGYYKYEDFEPLLSANKLPKATKIVCIETFEHMPEEDARKFVAKILSYLEIGGDMFLTVPMGNNGPSEYNEFHLFEPTIDYMYNLLGRAFKKMRFEISVFKNSFGFDTKFCMIILNSLEKTDL